MDMFRLGLVVNPLAGPGWPGRLEENNDRVAAEALAKSRTTCAGAHPDSPGCLVPLVEKIEFLTFPGAMGLSCSSALDSAIACSASGEAVSSAADTRLAVRRLQEAGVALILFAGGDWHSADSAGVVRRQQPVLGIPAGVKIHSRVYAVESARGGELAQARLVEGLVRLASGEVRDLDEALRADRVAARWYGGEMTVPEEGHFMQHVADPGMESEELVLVGLAELAGGAEDGVRYVLGPNSTLHGLAAQSRPGSHPAGRRRAGYGAVLARDVWAGRGCSNWWTVIRRSCWSPPSASRPRDRSRQPADQSPGVARHRPGPPMRWSPPSASWGPSGAAVAGRRRPSAGRQLPGRHPGLGRPGRTAVSAGSTGRTRTRPRAPRRRMDKDVSGALRRLTLLAMLGLPLAASPLRSNRSDWWMRRACPGGRNPGLRPGPRYRAAGLSGDVPRATRVCTDVVVRALRGQGLDLQKRRIARRHPLQLPAAMGDERHRPRRHRSPPRTEPDDLVQPPGPGTDAEPRLRLPGRDIVAWRLDNGLLHIGVLSDRRLEGRWLVLHNIGAGVGRGLAVPLPGHRPHRFPQGWMGKQAAPAADERTSIPPPPPPLDGGQRKTGLRPVSCLPGLSGIRRGRRCPGRP